jgi:hypothetical protein
MGWFTVLKFFLQAAAAIAGYLKDRQLMDAGAQRETSKMLVAISDRAGIAREIEAETAKMTPEQILRDLKDSGELRD